MATIIQQSLNSAHGTIDLIVEDAFGDRSHHLIHVGSTRHCAECGKQSFHEGAKDISAAKLEIIEMVSQAELRKIQGFEAAGFDMSQPREKLGNSQAG